MQAIIRIALALLVACASSQDILTVLGQQDGIEQFTDMLAQYPDLVDYLNTGVHTLVVPTDSAVDHAKSSMPDSFADNSSIRALLDYHVLNDTHPTATFTNSSRLVPTLLTNTTYTNVTGGQRVELRQKGGTPAFLSAVKAESKVVHGDIFYVGGLVHIVDSVLQIPLAFPSTITQANLTYLVALLNKGNWLTPTSVAYKLALETADLTILGPNAQDYGADFTGWNGLSQAQLDQIFVYHSLPELVYTPDMTNGSQFATLANLSITARDFIGPLLQSAIFLDQAHVTGSNYLTANGVLHIIDRPLDPSNPNATPAQSDVYEALGIPPDANGNGISTGSIVGIVIGVLAVLTATALVCALRLRMRRKRHQCAPVFTRVISNPNHRQMSPDYQPAMRDIPAPTNYSRSPKQTFIITPTRLSAPLPACPQPVARNTAPIQGALWPSRPPANNIIELDAKEYHVQMNESDNEESGAVQTGSNSDGSEKGIETRPPPTPPELDGKEMSRSESVSARSHMSITSHGGRPGHIGFQARID